MSKAPKIPDTDAAVDRQRIDKWLWHARTVRTRSAAAALIEAGYARVNGRRIAEPSHLVRAGDVITLALDRSVRIMKVEGFCERRGAPAEAQALYRNMASASGR